jgi:hypothetical protein
MASKAETDTVEHASAVATEELDAKPHNRDADDALWFAAESEAITWTDAEERKVLWKIDGVILSLVSSSTLEITSSPLEMMKTCLHGRRG